MRHLIISRELPPATYPAGGIGTYVANIARLLTERGDTVHVIGERWSGAPHDREVLYDGRLIIHRISSEDPPRPLEDHDAARMRRELEGLKETSFSAQWFAWSAGFLTERLVQEEGIDVIEAQEWEAPLYYFLLRRSIGLGPKRKPACIVHLHSPTAFIHHYNGPASAPSGLATTSRMEEFCIQSADVLLCPSRSLAAQAAKRYQIPPDRIQVIPLPVGFIPRIDRDESVWSHGAICFVGRLEPRKGVIEWVDAATRVARQQPTAHFDFVGADVWRLKDVLVKQIGDELAPRFRFHGPKSKEEIAVYLGRANAAVVPSRWENFPNVCIEAMSSGLPVIATRSGGMVELVEDGRSGWLAEDAGVAGLADSLAAALGRCLSTPPGQKAAMGAEAAQAVRRICDNGAITEAHQRFRSAAARQGSFRSSIAADTTAAIAPSNVVIRAPSIEDAEDLVRTLAAQTMPPQAIAVVYRLQVPQTRLDRLRVDAATHLLLHHAPNLVGPQGWNEGATLLASCPAPGFWLFLDHADTLAPDCLEQMATVFATRPDVGIVTPWTDRLGPERCLDARPSPTFPQQMIENDIAPASGFRAQAIGAEPPFRPGLPREYDVWALSNDVIAKGWAAVTLPSLLARRAATPRQTSWVQDTALRAIRAEALSAFDSEANRVALQIVDSYVPLVPRPRVSQRDEGLRRLVLRVLEAILLRPRDVVNRCFAYAKRRLTRVGEDS
jgi:glycogen(starch) synthase